MQHHITIPLGVARFILQRGRWVLAVVLAITLLAAVQIWRVPLSISALESFTSDVKAFEDYQSRAKLFGGDSDMLVFIATNEGRQLFTPRVLNAIRSACEALQQLPEIERVIALTEVTTVTDQPKTAIEMALADVARQQLESGKVPPIAGSLAIEPWWPRSECLQAGVDLNSFRQSLMLDKLISRRLLSADGNSHCMIVRLKPDAMGLGAKWKIRAQCTEILQSRGLGTSDLHISGLTISESWILEELVACLKYQLPLGVLIIGLIVFSIYRSLSIVCLTLLVGAIASVWAVAITGLVFAKITILVAAVPLLIIVISTSDTVHIVSAFTKEYREGITRKQALLRVIQDVGGACVLTSLTTLVGFLSLLLIPVTAIRHLAVTAGVGVALALVLAITIVPIGIDLLKFSVPDEKSRSAAVANSIISLLITLCRWISTTFPRSVVSLHLLAMAAATYFALGLQFDPNLTQRFHASHPMPVSIDYFNENFCGTNVVELFVQGDTDQLLLPENLKRLKEVQNRLLEMPEIHAVSGPNDLLELVHRAIDFQSDSGLPPTSTAAQASLGLLRQLQPELVRSVISPDGSLIKISAHTSLSGFFEVLNLSEKVHEVARGQLPECLNVEVSGVMPVIARSVDTIVRSQLSGMLFCFTVVLLIVMVALRSIRLGLVSLLPNIFPLVLLAGFLVYSSPTIDSDFIIIFTIAFGIAVDDTIHFLHRYDVELSHCGDRKRAVENAYHYTGNAIVLTTVVLGLGLSPLAMSNYLTIWMLGSYLVLTLVLAVFADLLFLPSLVPLFGE